MVGKRFVGTMVSVVLVLIVAISLSLVGACTPPEESPAEPTSPSEGEVYNLKIQSAWPHGDYSMETLSEFAASAEKRSNGQLDVSVFGAPDIVGMFEVPEAVKKGTLDMSHGSGMLWSGVLPIGDVEFGLPYGYKITEVEGFKEKANFIRDWYFDSGFIDLLRERYATQGVYLLDIHPYGPTPFMVATKPIKTVDDFTGTSIRADGMWMEWENACGANAQAIPGDEGYMALEMGTVKAAVWDLSCVTGLNWHEVAPYWVHGEENDHAIGHILVNMDAWNSLTDDLKQALAGAAEDYWYANLDVYAEQMGKIRDLVEEGKLTEVWMNDGLTALHEEVGYNIWDDVATRSDACAQAVEMFKEWRGVE